MNKASRILANKLIVRDAIERIGKLERKWIGLTGVEVNHIFAANVGYPERMMREVEKLLKDKNT
jgi:hypothetical protein